MCTLLLREVPSWWWLRTVEPTLSNFVLNKTSICGKNCALQKWIFGCFFLWKYSQQKFYGLNSIFPKALLSALLRCFSNNSVPVVLLLGWCFLKSGRTGVSLLLFCDALAFFSKIQLRSCGLKLSLLWRKCAALLRGKVFGTLLSEFLRILSN